MDALVPALGTDSTLGKNAWESRVIAADAGGWREKVEDHVREAIPISLTIGREAPVCLFYICQPVCIQTR
jgi:hypothetical protein